MTRIGIIICNRYGSCGGGKCFRALRERVGGFAAYPTDQAVEVVGFANCGGCPGGNIESVPEEMKKNGADVIHLATGLVVGYPPCPKIADFKRYIETRFGIPVVVGTHPIPLKYFDVHARLPFWTEMDMQKLAPRLLPEERSLMEAYD